MRELLVGDAYDLLKRSFAKETFRTIITSPRYNKGKDYHDPESGVFVDDSTTRDEYLHEMALAGKLLYDLAAQDCVFFLNVGDDTEWPDRSWQVMERYVGAGWVLAQPAIIWAKSLLGHGHFTPINKLSNTLNQMSENIFILVKDPRKYKLDRKAVGVPHTDPSNIERFSGDGIRCAGNIWHIPYETTGKTMKKCHSCPFPVELPRRCILLNGRKGPVLDPFAGILSTALAAEELGVEWAAIEKIPSSAAIGIERLRNAKP